MYNQKVSSMFIGVHPANRDGFGVSAKHVHELLDDLVSLGWSQAKFRGLCVEVSDSERPTVFQWNQELAQQSRGPDPPVPVRRAGEVCHDWGLAHQHGVTLLPVQDYWTSKSTSVFMGVGGLLTEFTVHV